MSFVHLNGISLAYGDRDILKDINISLNSGDKIAIAGLNGSGKSTLLKIFSGSISPDTGTRSVSPDTRIGYLPQHGIEHSGKKLEAEADTAYEFFHRLEEKRIETEHEISALPESSPQLQTLLTSHLAIMEILDGADYYNRKRHIDSVLHGLGFTAADLEKDTSAFSGGWQMRIALAKLLLSNPEFLLLDEPTNYLDLEARNWLESFLQSYRGGYCIVSHDRFFLDSTVKRVAEIFLAKLEMYSGNYTAYEQSRLQKIAMLEKEYAKQQMEIKKLEEFISRFRYNQSKAAQVQSRIKTLEKILPVEIPPGFQTMSIRFPDPPHSGKHVLKLLSITKSYGEHTVIGSFSMEIMRGEKIVLSGQNGAGKSTLMRIIAGQDTGYTGDLQYGTDVKVGYFAQDFDKKIKGTLSIIEFMEQQCPTALLPRLRDMLGGFLFHGDDIHKHLDVLSGGEKSRIALLSLLLSPSNVLVLDEPTNHLDLKSKDILLDALARYSGTVVFVSHDRDFIERLATKVVNLSENPPKIYHGDYSYFLSQYNANGEQDRKLDEENSKEISENQLSREERKKIKMRLRKLSEQEADILNQLEKLENEKNKLVDKLIQPEVYANGEQTRGIKVRLSSIESDELKLHSVWEETASELSDLQSRFPDT